MRSRRSPVVLKVCVLIAFAAVALFGAGPESASAAGGVALSSIAAGHAHNCAVSAQGAVSCWGNNGVGQVGDGTTSFFREPAQVTDLASGVAELAAGAYHTCALTTGGGLKCWGSDQYGQLGAEATELCGPCSTVPLDVIGLGSGVTAVAAGGYHTCALIGGGGAKCWGRNDDGQLGNGTTTNSETPVDVLAEGGGLLTGLVALTAGNGHTCALTTGGAVLCWGGNEYGQLGNGARDDAAHPVPAAVSGLAGGVATVAAGATSTHTCASLVSGGVKCWGSNTDGQLGNGTSGPGQFSAVPVDVLDLGSGVSALSLGGENGQGRGHTCALMNAGSVNCWGDNFQRQLGNGTWNGGSDTPVPVCSQYDSFLRACREALSGVTAVAAGSFHTCALPGPIGTTCWGTCALGQLGLTECPETAIPFDMAFDGDSDGLYDSYESGRACLDEKSDDAFDDADGDGLANISEFSFLVFGAGPFPLRTDPCVSDTDRDGCGDGREGEADAALGGARDPIDFWDFFSVPTGAPPARDSIVDIGDIGAVVRRFGATGEPRVDPLSPPPPAPAYHPAFDRSAPGPGGELWNLRPPDGVIQINDIGFVVVQFGHTCA